MESLYRVIGRSRQSFWKSKVRGTELLKKEEEIIETVLDYRERHPMMGSRVLFHTIKNTSGYLRIGVTKFEYLMSDRKLTIKKRKSWIPKTSDGKGGRDYKNLTNGLVLNDINQLLVSDITYYKMGEKSYYIFSIKDVYSQRILELLPSKNLEAKTLFKAIQNVAKIRGKKQLENCIFHSDNGSQYGAHEVITLLQVTLKMQISRANSCQENGSSEQSHHLVKNMYLTDKKITNFKQLCKECKRVKYLINNERAVKQLKYKSVIMFENSLKEINLEHRVKKTMYDFENKT